MKAVNLKTEHLVNPMGIDIVRPYLSWNCQNGKMQSAMQFALQTAYEIEASENGQVVWNS